MGLAELEPGKYKGFVVDHGVREIEKLDGALQAVVRFELETGDEIEWKSFFLRKDGQLNQKTIKIIRVLGARDAEHFLEDDWMDKTKGYELELKRNDAGFLDVEWVNDPDAKPKPSGGEFIDKRSAKAKLKSLASSKTGQKAQSKAPPAELNVDDEFLL